MCMCVSVCARARLDLFYMAGSMTKNREGGKGEVIKVK